MFPSASCRAADGFNLSRMGRGSSGAALVGGVGAVVVTLVLGLLLISWS